MLDALRNRKKPILGAVAFAVAYVVARVLLDMGEEEAIVAAGTVSAVVVERVGPIFGEDVSAPKVETGPRGGKTVKVKVKGTEKKLETK